MCPECPDCPDGPDGPDGPDEDRGPGTAREPVRSPRRGGTRYAESAASGRYGQVVGYDGGPLPAPVLPDVRLRPRTRPAR